MKSLFYIFIILLFSPYLKAEKIALIIAIGNYPEESGWNKISSINDVVHLKEAFTAIGIKSENITIISDARATKKGIIESINTLRENCNSGDKVFIHFSGHGQQIFDVNGDEIDLLDEAIVPYDSPLEYKSGIYQGENLISDDQLSDLLYDLRVKLSNTGSLLLTLDSCHSGTATRANNSVRGTTKLMAPSSFEKSEYFIPENDIGLKSNSQDDLAPMVNLFGSSCRQLNYETVDENNLPVGSFSYSLSKNLRNAKSGYSYKELFDNIRIHMKQIAPWQDPSWEGDIDMPIFNEAIQDGSNLFNILELPTSNTAVISCGQLNNVFEGDEITFYDTNNKSEIATGTVIQSFILSSKVKIHSLIPIDKSTLHKVQVSKRIYQNNVITIKNNLDVNNIWFNSFYEAAESEYIANFEINPDFIVTNGTSKNTFNISTSDGKVIFENNSAPTLDKFNKTEEILEFLNSNNSSILNLEILIVDCENSAKSRTLKEGEKLHLGDCIKFRIKNIGKKTRHFCLFNITPNHELIEVIPTRNFGYTPQEYFLKKNETFTSNFHIEIKSTGSQTLKLISSKKPLNFLNFLKDNPISKNDKLASQMLLLNLHQKYFQKNNKSSNVDFKFIETLTVLIETIE